MVARRFAARPARRLVLVVAFGTEALGLMGQGILTARDA
jgi:hypothetical protein